MPAATVAATGWAGWHAPGPDEQPVVGDQLGAAPLGALEHDVELDLREPRLAVARGHRVQARDVLDVSGGDRGGVGDAQHEPPRRHFDGYPVVTTVQPNGTRPATEPPTLGQLLDRRR